MPAVFWLNPEEHNPVSQAWQPTGQPGKTGGAALLAGISQGNKVCVNCQLTLSGQHSAVQGRRLIGRGHESLSRRGKIHRADEHLFCSLTPLCSFTLMENIKLTRQSNISQGNCNIHFPVKIRPHFISVIRHSNNTLVNVQNSNNNNSKITQATCWLLFPMVFVKKRSWKTCRNDKAATFQAPAIFIHRLQENLEPMVLQSNHEQPFTPSSPGSCLNITILKNVATDTLLYDSLKCFEPGNYIWKCTMTWSSGLENNQ